jgi:hypothetical protein
MTFTIFGRGADQCDQRHDGAATGRFRSTGGFTSGSRRQRQAPMELLSSWTRSTVANIERRLSRTDDHFDRILVGVLVLLAIAIAILFLF